MKRSKTKEGTKEVVKKLIVRDILLGKTRSQIIDKIQSNGYTHYGDCSNATANKLYNDAKNVIVDDMQETMPLMRNKVMNQLNDVYNDARNNNDRSNALKALDQINKMSGFYENKISVDANVKTEIVIDFGFDDGEDSQNQGD